MARSVLHATPSCAFQARYFEIAPGGFSSHEYHEHEHFVLVVRGSGEVLLGDQTEPITAHDIVSIGPGVPHQFTNSATDVLGILCVVDAVRDRPVLVGQTKEVLGASKEER